MVESAHAANFIAEIQRNAPLALRPSDVLAFAPDRADEVETPNIALPIEGQGLERQGDLGFPSRLVHTRGRLPDAIPIHIEGHAAEQQTIALHAVRVDVENVAGAPVVIGVEQELDVVVVEHALSLHELRALDQRRLPITEPRADVEILIVAGEEEFRGLARRLAIARSELLEVANGHGAAPERLVEPAVDAHRLFEPRHIDALGYEALFGRLNPSHRETHAAQQQGQKYARSAHDRRIVRHDLHGQTVGVFPYAVAAVRSLPRSALHCRSS